MDAKFAAIQNGAAVRGSHAGGEFTSFFDLYLVVIIISCHKPNTILSHHPKSPCPSQIQIVIKWNKGAFVAALGDLSFNALGYIVIFFNDLFTALNGVILKRTTEGKCLSSTFTNSRESSQTRLVRCYYLRSKA